jgi:hypothetical protein
MGWVQLRSFYVKAPDRHPDDPDEHYVVLLVSGDGHVETAGYSTTNPLTDRDDKETLESVVADLRADKEELERALATLHGQATEGASG